MAEMIKKDKDMFELTRRIVEQNGKILEINAALIKVLSTPVVCIERKEND